MQYNDSYFEPEVREGFALKSMNKRFLASTMESLEQVDRICKKYGITYFAYYGTLLGAVRHKGFIPWDDDVDIAMMREDYNRFIIAAREDLDKEFSLLNVQENCLHPLRVINGNSIRMDAEFLERFHLCPYPSGIDIFPIDKIPTNDDDKEILRLMYQIASYVGMAVDSSFEKVMGKTNDIDEDTLHEFVDALEDISGVHFVRDNTLNSQIAVLMDRMEAMYNNTDSKHVTRMGIWYTDGIRETIPIECFDGTIMMPFEQMEVPVPVGYDTILRKTYGDDYMTPKPGGGAHQYGIYKENEQLLLDEYAKRGLTPPAYLFT